MKKVFLFTLLFSAYFCSAQNYQCLQSGVKHYFINGNGYLRGIRIDSVKTVGSDIEYFPYKTFRNSSLPLDTTNGSWLGGHVIQKTDGSFFFNTIFNDTVIIKTLANPGDSWIFYNDTTGNYYTATIISIDTLTILGSLDSVKTILINAFSSGVLNTADSINNFELKLSKNNGFVQVFDLYTFPYHVSDYFFNKAAYYSHNYASAQSFKIVNFHNPTLLELCDYNPGDYFERKTSTTSSPVVSYCREQNIGYSGYQIDSIVTKTIIDPYHTQYTFLHTGVEDDHNYYLNTTSHSEIISHDTLTVDTTKFFDHLKMPEEYVDNCLYYFYPLDTIFCFSNASYLTLSEGTCCPYEKFYKTGLGQLMTVTDVYGKASCEDLLIAQINNSLVYVNKDGVSCGSYHSLSINNLEKNSGAFQLYPNPATTSLTITSTEKINQITINKLIGQTVYTHEYNTEKVQVDVSGLPNGIYFVKINGSEVRKFVKE